MPAQLGDTQLQVQPLTSQLSAGSAIAFNGTNVILREDAFIGATLLQIHPLQVPLLSGQYGESVIEFLRLPYARKLIARGGILLGGTSTYYPYSLVNPEITQIGGILLGGVSGRLNKASGGILISGVTERSLLLRLIGGFSLGGEAVSYTHIVQSVGGVSLGGTTTASAETPVHGGLLIGGLVLLGTTTLTQGGVLIGGDALALSSFAFGGIVLGGSAFKEISGLGPLEAAMFGAADLETLMFS